MTLIRSRSGAMLLEYVLLLTSVVVIVAASTALFYDPVYGQFGELGAPAVHLFHRLITLISLPVP